MIPESMHFLWLGLTKMLLTVLTEAKGMPYSVSAVDIDKTLNCIQTTDKIRRCPRSFVSFIETEKRVSTRILFGFIHL